MTIIFLSAWLIFAVIDWFAVAKKIKRLEYICKPGVMFVLLLYLFLSADFRNGIFWFAFGIFFSLWGDIFLMLPKRPFMAGLVFFLLAHLSYIAGFNNFNLEFNIASFVLLISIAFSSFNVYQLVTSRKVYFYRADLKIPILFYTIAISTMLFCAALTFTSDTWPFIPSFMVSIGAFLFYISDSIIAINRYVPPIRINRVISTMTYHIGQALIIIGVIYQTNFRVF
ncbi:MAG: lysoplasmalogenase [Chloroflexi bacterium]|nr:lysoplasmalogenase [Chloroflexota bacterium]